MLVAELASRDLRGCCNVLWQSLFAHAGMQYPSKRSRSRAFGRSLNVVGTVYAVALVCVLRSSLWPSVTWRRTAFIDVPCRTHVSASVLRRPVRYATSRLLRRAKADEEDEEEEATRLFRERLSRSWESDVSPWGSAGGAVRSARAIEEATAGSVLLANPEAFASTASRAGAGRFGKVDGVAGLLLRVASWFGFGCYDLVADALSWKRSRLMPVVLVTDRRSDGTAAGVALTTRTGKLLGDFANSGEFMTRPVYWGGPSEASLSLVHPYKEVLGAKALGETGLFAGGDLDSARSWVSDGQGSSLRFRFFAGQVQWGPGELDRELQANHWFPVECTSECVLDESAQDTTGVPLWAELAAVSGGAAADAGRRFSLFD